MILKGEITCSSRPGVKGLRSEFIQGKKRSKKQGLNGGTNR